MVSATGVRPASRLGTAVPARPGRPAPPGGLVLKYLPVIELVFVTSGFVLRALGGAAATHVPPSGWFLLVCTLGAFLVATAKRYTEMAVLGADAVRHRPSMRWYRPAALRLTQRITAVAMIIAYLLWAPGGHGAWIRGWHLASALPLAATLVRFDHLTAQASPRPEEYSRNELPQAGHECEQPHRFQWFSACGESGPRRRS